jgi:hypothetical protein
MSTIGTLLRRRRTTYAPDFSTPNSPGRKGVPVLAAVLAVALVVAVTGDNDKRPATAHSSTSPQSPWPGPSHPAPGGSWSTIYREDFEAQVAEGGFVNHSTDDWELVDGIPYARSLRSYPDGWATTHHLSVNFASRTASVVSEAMGAHGVFQLRAHSAEIDGRTRALGGSFTSVIRPDASTGQLQVAQTYGRYTVRFRTVGGYRSGTDPAAGAGYGTAFLLWPASDSWAEGEIDFPEMAWGGRIAGFVHTIGKPSVTSMEFRAETTTEEGWNVATIEWTPGLLRFFLNSEEIARTTSDVPSTPFRWGFQSGGMLSTPPADVTGYLYVDSILIEAYRPS